MTPAALLHELHRHGVEVIGSDPPRLAWGDREPPADLLDQARQHRDALIALVVAGGEASDPAALTNGHVPEIAWAGVARLAEMAPAADFTPARWVVAVQVCQYLATQWLDHALALGWDLPDVFGCDPVKPYATLHRAGLALCMRDGDRISAITADRAAISRSGGAVRIFHRMANDPARVLLWEVRT